MDLLSEIYERTAAFVDGRATLVDLRDWIADASEIADEEELESARVFSARIWRHISEHGYGHLADASLSAVLANVISPTATPWDREHPIAITTAGVSLNRTGHSIAGYRGGYQPGARQLVG